MRTRECEEEVLAVIGHIPRSHLSYPLLIADSSAFPDVEHGNAKPTGQFNYTFSVPKDVKVMPHTYQEYMMYIDARRRVKLGDLQFRQEHSGSSEDLRQLAEGTNLTE